MLFLYYMFFIKIKRLNMCGKMSHHQKFSHEKITICQGVDAFLALALCKETVINIPRITGRGYLLNNGIDRVL